MTLRKLAIESDGTGPGTRVLVDGEPLDGVVSLAIAVERKGLARVAIEVQAVPFVVTGDYIETHGLVYDRAAS